MLTVLKLGTVKIPALDYHIKVIVTDSVSEYQHSLGICDHGSNPEASHLFGGSHDSMLVFHPFPSPGTVSHEAWHAVRQMMLNAGAELDNELVAYHLGYIVEEVHKLLFKNVEKMEEMPCSCGCEDCLGQPEKPAKKSKKEKA